VTSESWKLPALVCLSVMCDIGLPSMYLSRFSFEIEGYVAGFGNPDWKKTHEAARHTAVAVTMLRKQGATCVGRTIMDELGFGFVSFVASN
jgi:hypothetical protein